MRPLFQSVVIRGGERLLASLLLALIALYRALVSPLLVALTGGGCRFTPSCSVYAAECIRLDGPLTGGRRALSRLLRCHPFHPGGYDPPARERR